MTLLQAVLLGLVQGLTEFLPISSTAHLRVLPALLGWKDPGARFSAVIQLGTVAAVLTYFRADLWRMTRGIWNGIRSRRLMDDVDARQGLFVLAGSVPIIAAGLIFKDFITTSLRSLYVIATALVVVALIMTLAETVAARRAGRFTATVSFGDAVAIGLAQACALIPGVSRSGSTLAMGLFRGLGRGEAARFSFLLSIPAITGAGVLAAFDLGTAGGVDGDAVLHMAVGTLVSFGAGYAAIGGLLAFLARRSVHVFIVYRLVAGAALFVLAWLGVLE